MRKLHNCQLCKYLNLNIGIRSTKKHLRNVFNRQPGTLLTRISNYFCVHEHYFYIIWDMYMMISVAMLYNERLLAIPLSRTAGGYRYRRDEDGRCRSDQLFSPVLSASLFIGPQQGAEGKDREKFR